MSLGICSFASSSSGNCYLVKSKMTNILVDVGISGSKIIDGLSMLQLSLDNLSGVLITHEHIDHIKSVKSITKKAVSAEFFSSCGTIDALAEKTDKATAEKFSRIKAGQPFEVGDIKVSPFNISHDAAEPVGYTFENDGRKIAIVTDTGCITGEIMDAIKDADILVMEANHEKNILLYGKYPYNLKHRILSDKGHLSNEAAGKCLCHILNELKGEKVPQIFLAHLSKENNTPQQAFLTIRNILEEADFYIGKDLNLEIFKKDEMSRFVAV